MASYSLSYPRLLPDDSWREHAACLGTDPDIFFPEEDLGRGQVRQTTAYRARVERAKEVCRRCPVAAACLDYVLYWEPGDVRVGVWGGTSPEERRRMAAVARGRSRRPEVSEGRARVLRSEPSGSSLSEARPRRAEVAAGSGEQGVSGDGVP